MAEENLDIVESLQTYNNSKQIHNSKAYKMFAENKVDNFELLGIDKENAAGTYPIKEKDPKIQETNEKSFINDILEFGNELKDSDVVTSINSRVPEGAINIADFGTNIFNTFDKLFSLDPTYERSEIFNKWSENLGKVRNKLQEKREDVESITASIAGIILQDMPAFFVIDGILKKAKIKPKYRLPLSFGLSYAMSFHETDEDIFINSEAINNLKHILNILPDTPEDQLMDDLVQMGVGWGSAKIFQGIKPAIKWIKRNVPRKTVSDVAAGTAAGAVLTKSVMDEAEEKRISDLEKITTVDEDKIREEKKTPELGDQSSNQTMMQEFYGLDKTQLEKISEATGFPVDELQSAGITNPKLAVEFLKAGGKKVQELIKLKGGTGRIVFELDNKKVIKIARKQRGLRENDLEGDFVVKNWLPKFHTSGRDYVVVENVARADNELRQFLKPLRKFSQIDFDNKTPELQEALTKMELGDFMNYNLAWGDFTATRNWGKTKDGRFVLLDAGALDIDALLYARSDYKYKGAEYRSMLDKDWMDILADRKAAGMGKFVIVLTAGGKGYRILDNQQNNIISKQTENK